MPKPILGSLGKYFDINAPPNIDIYPTRTITSLLEDSNLNLQAQYEAVLREAGIEGPARDLKEIISSSLEDLKKPAQVAKKSTTANGKSTIFGASAKELRSIQQENDLIFQWAHDPEKTFITATRVRARAKPETNLQTAVTYTLAFFAFIFGSSSDILGDDEKRGAVLATGTFDKLLNGGLPGNPNAGGIEPQINIVEVKNRRALMKAIKDAGKNFVPYFNHASDSGIHIEYSKDREAIDLQ